MLSGPSGAHASVIPGHNHQELLPLDHCRQNVSGGGGGVNTIINHDTVDTSYPTPSTEPADLSTQLLSTPSTSLERLNPPLETFLPTEPLYATDCHDSLLDLQSFTGSFAQAALESPLDIFGFPHPPLSTQAPAIPAAEPDQQTAISIELGWDAVIDHYLFGGTTTEAADLAAFVDDYLENSPFSSQPSTIPDFYLTPPDGAEPSSSASSQLSSNSAVVSPKNPRPVGPFKCPEPKCSVVCATRNKLW